MRLFRAKRERRDRLTNETHRQLNDVSIRLTQAVERLEAVAESMEQRDTFRK